MVRLVCIRSVGEVHPCLKLMVCLLLKFVVCHMSKVWVVCLSSQVYGVYCPTVLSLSQVHAELHSNGTGGSNVTA